MRLCPDSPPGFGLPMIWLETWANCKTILECFKVLNYGACFEHAGLPIVLLINFFAHRNYNLHPEKHHKNGKPLSFPEEIHLQIVDVHGLFQSHVGFPEHSNMGPPHGDVFFFPVHALPFLVPGGTELPKVCSLSSTFNGKTNSTLQTTSCLFHDCSSIANQMWKSS